MRYFSHEVRTPLNSVYVGVTIMLNELNRLVQQEQGNNQGLLETAVDAQQSCQFTVDILNGMILYDRLLSGLVTLEKCMFDPWKLVCDATNPFRIQVMLLLLLPYWRNDKLNLLCVG